MLQFSPGRYWANISDTVLAGEFRQWAEGEMYASVHLPGKLEPHFSFVQ